MKTYTVVVLISLSLLTSCSKSSETKFSEVQIGDQIWMAQSLNVSTFRNGDPILEAKTNEEWRKAGQEGRPAWCYLNNDSINGEKYGMLYNWYAVSDPRGLAPDGWHIPSEDEWAAIESYLGNENGFKMKSKDGWSKIESIDNNGSNESGFSALPSGYRMGEAGHFFGYKLGDEVANYWSSTASPENYHAWQRAIYNSEKTLHKDKRKGNSGYDGFPFSYGLSVRCVRDLDGQGEIPNENKISSKTDLSTESPNTSNLELLQGKWQSEDDENYFLIFEGNIRKESTDGNVDTETFVLSNRCMNPMDKNDIVPTDEEDRYISFNESDMCYYIDELSAEKLVLAYSGNYSVYLKVK